MTLMDLQRRARDAAASARRNLVPGTVKAVHNGDSDLAMLAGSTPGQPLYTVTAFGRRGQEYDLFPVASPIPIQVGQRVFLSFLDGDLSRGAWITGLTHPPVPQVVEDTVDVMAFGAYVSTGPSLPMPELDKRLVRVDDAFVVTARQMRISFSLELPAAPGKHDVDQLLTVVGLNKETVRTGARAGATVQWEADARLVHGTRILGVATHGFIGLGVVTEMMLVNPTPTLIPPIQHRWQLTEQLLTPRAVWTGVFDTGDVIGDPVALELYLVGTFVNPNEYTLPAEWSFSSNQVRYSAVEAGFGSGLTPAP